MRADRVENGRYFFLRKMELLQQIRRAFDGIGHIVPRGQGCSILGPVADEYAEVMQPGGCKDYVLIEWLVNGELAGKSEKSWLMAELVGRFGLGPDVIDDGLAVVGLCHGV